MGFKSTIKNWVKESVRTSLTDMSRVQPEIRFSQKENAIYLNSCAGLIKFKSYDPKEFEFFRNNFVNRFNMVEDGDHFFKLYKEIFKTKWTKRARVKYIANLRTRMRMKIAG